MCPKDSRRPIRVNGSPAKLVKKNRQPAYFYKIYGITLESHIPLPRLTRFPCENIHENGRIRLGQESFDIPNSGTKEILRNGISYQYAFDDHLIFVSSPFVGNFRIDIKRKMIDWKPAARYSRRLAETTITGRVLGLILSHLDSFLILHGCVLVVNGKGICLLGQSGFGKSTLGAYFLNHGFSLLADDLAVIRIQNNRFTLEPGPAEIRLWPQASKRLNWKKMKGEGVYSKSKKKRFPLGVRTSWRYFEKPVSLERLYILSRQKEEKIAMETLVGKEALIGIVKNFYNPIVQGKEISTKQFDKTVWLSEKIPVKRLTYPSGFSHLPKVYQTILSDLKGLSKTTNPFQRRDAAKRGFVKINSGGRPTLSPRYPGRTISTKQRRESEAACAATRPSAARRRFLAGRGQERA